MDVISWMDFNSHKIAGHSQFFSHGCTEGNHSYANEMSLERPMQFPQFFCEKLTDRSCDDMRYCPLLEIDSDWMLAELTDPWSPPASPHIKSNQTGSLYFNLSSASERKKYEAYQSPSVSGSTPSKRFQKRLFDADIFSGTGEIVYPPVKKEESAPCTVLRSIRNVNICGLKQREVDMYSEVTDSSKQSHKRQLEEEFTRQRPKKRQLEAKDLTRVFGLRYLKVLKEEVKYLRMKLKRRDKNVSEPVDCTCAVMERYFLQMAESAYRSLRRMDCSPRGFQQFRNELIQTNAVLQDSIEVLRNIKSFCEHQY